VTTEVDLDRPLREPTQPEIGISQLLPNDEAGIGQVRLARDRSHPLIRGDFVEHDHRCGIAAKRPVGE